jgi:hypothetical protein
MPTNVGCQNIDSQVQGDGNAVALSAEQTFPGAPGGSGVPTIDVRITILCPADLPPAACSAPASHLRALDINTVPQSVPQFGPINVLNEGQAQVNIFFLDATELQFNIRIDEDKLPFPSPGLFLTPDSVTQTCSGTVNTQQSSTCIFTFEYVKG